MPFVPNRLPWKATVKVYPAIGDLQAVTGFVREIDTHTMTEDAHYDQYVYTVPADSIFHQEFIRAQCTTGNPSFIYFQVEVALANYVYYGAVYGGAWEIHDSLTPLILNAGEKVLVRWLNAKDNDYLTVYLFGYLTHRY